MTSNIASPAFQSSKSYVVRQHDDGDLDLGTLTDRERVVFYSGYRSGLALGIDVGREQRDAERDDEEERAWSRMAAHVRRLGGPLSLPYSRVCELRGEGATERAEAARAVEQALGVAS